MLKNKRSLLKEVEWRYAWCVRKTGGSKTQVTGQVRLQVRLQVRSGCRSGHRSGQVTGQVRSIGRIFFCQGN